MLKMEMLRNEVSGESEVGIYDGKEDILIFHPYKSSTDFQI